MKHLFICLLAVFLTACSSESTSRPTPLVEMTKYEIENHEQLQKLEMEYITYAEMYEEPVDDWLFDMDKRVMEDDAIVGYYFSFPKSDNDLGITVDEFNTFLDFAIDTDQTFNFEEEDIEILYESGFGYSAMFKVGTDDENYLVQYQTDKPYYDSDEYYITSGSIYLAD